MRRSDPEWEGVACETDMDHSFGSVSDEDLLPNGEDAYIVNLKDELKEKERLVGNLRDELEKEKRLSANLRDGLKEKELLTTKLQGEVEEREVKLQEKERQVMNILSKCGEANQLLVNLRSKHAVGVANLQHELEKLVEEKDKTLELLRQSEREKERVLHVLRRREARHNRCTNLLKYICNGVSIFCLVVGIICGLMMMEPIKRNKELEMVFSSYLTYNVSGPNTLTATANHVAKLKIVVHDILGDPCQVQLYLSVYIQPLDNSKASIKASVIANSPSEYVVSFTAVSRGKHRVHIWNMNKEITNSPFIIIVYPPIKKWTLVSIVPGLQKPTDLAINSKGEMIVSQKEYVTVIDKTNFTLLVYGSKSSPQNHSMSVPKGVAVDNSDNVYVVSQHKLQKFNRAGNLLNAVRLRRGNDTLSRPESVAVYESYVFVCDDGNELIHVFNLDLKYKRTIDRSQASDCNKIEIVKPNLDSVTVYIVDIIQNTVHVVSFNGTFLRKIGEDDLDSPTDVHIAGEFMYVVDCQGYITVYRTSGELVTSFQIENHTEKSCKRALTTDNDGYFYVTDYTAGKIYKFT